MSLVEQEFYNSTTPIAGEIAVIATTTGSTTTDLSLAAQLGDIAIEGRYLTFEADGEDVFWFMGDGTGTASATATAGATRTSRLPNGASVDRRLRRGQLFLTMISLTGGNFMRVSVTSTPPGKD